MFGSFRVFVGSWFRRVTCSSGVVFFEFGSRMSDKSAPQTPSRAAGSREDPILGVKVKDFLCAEMIVTSGLLRNVRAGSLLCADGALAWSAAAAKYPSKRLAVKHVKHVKSQWTKRANGQLEADSDDLWHPAARLAVVVDEEIHLATKREPVQRIGEPTAVE